MEPEKRDNETDIANFRTIYFTNHTIYLPKYYFHQ